MVIARAIEFIVLFFACPTAFAYARHRLPAIPALWVLMAYCLFILLRDPNFNSRRLWDPSAIESYAAGILALFALALGIGVLLMRRYAPPDLLLSLPRAKPGTWGLVMVLYPLLSVYPQNIIYRVFVFDRYRALFGPPWAIVLASAVAFAYVHIIFRNRLAVFLTFLGGILFGLRYLETGSVLVSWFEHTLYGCAIFTLGLGGSFYHAAVRESMTLTEPRL
jgi:membrane protease YdiL (CAAX protease family)